MNSAQLWQLERQLWSAADNIRVNSNPKLTEYFTLVRGLIFLKFADNKYKQLKSAIIEEYEKCGFYLPDHARYNYLLGNFAMAQGQGGGESFKPRRAARLVVEIIEPHQDTVFDSACGSGGVFVQSSQIIEKTMSLLGNARHEKVATCICGPFSEYSLAV